MNVPARLITILALGLCVIPGARAFEASELLRQIQQNFIELGREVRPCVVNIRATSQIESRGSAGIEDMLRMFGFPVEEGAPERLQRRITTGQGSGFLYDKQGHIITNNHVVAGAKDITVRLWDGEEVKAKIVGLDDATDLAVIKIDTTKDLPTAVFGDSDTVQVGQFAIALGSPQGLEGSFSFGHITALGREGLNLPRSLRFQNFIQTDAAINLGNSGGPLCDIDGKVIGINTAIVFGADSLGFAIPINRAKEIVPILISEGEVKRGFLGVQIRPAADYSDAVGLPDKKGAFVEGVLPSTPAERAGVKVYDVIRKVDGQVVEDNSDLVLKISKITPGKSTRLEVWRDGRTMELDVILDKFKGLDTPVIEEKAELGMEVQNIPAEMLKELGLEGGVIVTFVEPGTPASDADVRQRDIIIEIGREPVSNVSDFQELIEKHAQPGRQVMLRVQRGGEVSSVLVLKVPPKTEN